MTHSSSLHIFVHFLVHQVHFRKQRSNFLKLFYASFTCQLVDISKKFSICLISVDTLYLSTLSNATVIMIVYASQVSQAPS